MISDRKVHRDVFYHDIDIILSYHPALTYRTALYQKKTRRSHKQEVQKSQQLLNNALKFFPA